MWLSFGLNPDVELGDDAAVVCSVVSAAQGLGHMHILPVLLPENDTVDEVQVHP
jgi:hypothetical protein